MGGILRKLTKKDFDALDFSAKNPPKFGMADKVKFVGDVKLDLSRPKMKF